MFKPDKNQKYDSHAEWLVDLVRQNQVTRLAEVGVLKGDLAVAVLEGCLAVERYYLVDPWLEYPAHKRDPAYPYWRQDQWDAVFAAVVERMEPWKHKVEILKMRSAQAVAQVPDGSLDLVYIDGHDEYEDVRAYIGEWLPKVKPGGIVAGHDWRDEGEDQAEKYEGVRRAAGEAFPGVQVGEPAANWGHSWFAVKSGSMSREAWREHNAYERAWWGDCSNTSDEEVKQLLYAEHMGLEPFNVYDKERRFGGKFDMRGKSVLDVGGGPCSLLLKCQNVAGTVLDPCEWPAWVMERYGVAGVRYVWGMAEEMDLGLFDEVWLYNVLQHVWDPREVILRCLEHGRKVRVFEWLDTQQELGHPHVLTREFLDDWFGARGKVFNLNWSGYPMPTYALEMDVPQPKAVYLNEQKAGDITIIVTSTGRFDLLERMVESLLAHFGRLARVMISDDSGDEEQEGKIARTFGDRFDVFIQGQNRGPAYNRDFLYSRVRTPYLFHCEDDWEFLDGGFVEKSLSVLKERPDVVIVGLAKDEQFERLGAVGDKHETSDGVTYWDHPRWRIDDQHAWWHGWIGSPHLLRRADWLKLGRFSAHRTEHHYDLAFGRSGKQSVWLDRCYVKHTGGGRSSWKSEDKERVWSPHFGGKKPDELRFHLLAPAHVPAHRDVSPCAYTQKVVKLSKMLTDLGHEVFLYAGEGSEAECTELIQVVTDEERRECYGDYDWRTAFFKHDGNDACYTAFNRRAAEQIVSRMQPRDFMLCSMGTYQKPAADEAKGIATRRGVALRVVESGVGYRGVFADRRVFESYAWMHYVYGLTGQNDGSWYDAVIPNYFDPADFPFEPQKKDYALFVGRLIRRKGVDVAVEVTEKLGMDLVIAGQGTLKNPDEGLDIKGGHVHFVGTVGPEKRKALMGKARVVFVPTYYVEPFGGVAVEAMMCGTPVVTTDWGAMSETVLHGVTGYRCRTFDDFTWAVENSGNIDVQACRRWAVENYSMERVAGMYEEYFRKLDDIWGDGWYEPHPERTGLDWLRKRYPWE